MLRTIFILSVCLFNLISCYLPILSRSLEKSGFHRELITVLEIPAGILPDTKGSFKPSCRVLFQEMISSSAFVDPFQLASLRDFGGPDYLLTEAVDVEGPEYESSSLTVCIFGNLTKRGEKWTANYTLPVHMRDHAVTDKDYTTVTFENPEVSLRCREDSEGLNKVAVKKSSAPCDSISNNVCKWTQIQYEKKYEDLQIEVPVGQTNHYFIVTTGTVLTTILGCVFLAYHAISCKNNSKVS